MLPDTSKMTPEEIDALQVKVASCPTCGGWITQAAYPHCETSKESKKGFRQCLDAGLNINVITLGEAKKMKYCNQLHLKPKVCTHAQ